MRRDLLQLSSAAVLACAHVGDLPCALPLTAIRSQIFCKIPLLHRCHMQRPATAVTIGCAALVLYTLLKRLCVGICLTPLAVFCAQPPGIVQLCTILLLQLAEALDRAAALLCAETCCSCQQRLCWPCISACKGSPCAHCLLRCLWQKLVYSCQVRLPALEILL